jgi:dTDP-4-amino-4,6-dideoxygalactose transaminase
MEPYRSYYPHAGLVLPNTRRVAERVIVLPNGAAVDEEQVDAILSVLTALGLEGARADWKQATGAEHA